MFSRRMSWETSDSAHFRLPNGETGRLYTNPIQTSGIEVLYQDVGIQVANMPIDKPISIPQ